MQIQKVTDADLNLDAGSAADLNAMLDPDSASRYEVRWQDWEKVFLGNVIPQLRDMLMDGNSDLLRRLYPTAYVEDPEANDKYADLVHDQLLASRLAALETLEEALDKTEATGADLIAWMQSFNNLRLVIGTRLDVSEDQDHSEIGPDHPDKNLWDIYDVLNMFLSVVLYALED